MEDCILRHDARCTGERRACHVSKFMFASNTLFSSDASRCEITTVVGESREAPSPVHSQFKTTWCSLPGRFDSFTSYRELRSVCGRVSMCACMHLGTMKKSCNDIYVVVCLVLLCVPARLLVYPGQQSHHSLTMQQLRIYGLQGIILNP